VAVLKFDDWIPAFTDAVDKANDEISVWFREYFIRDINVRGWWSVDGRRQFVGIEWCWGEFSG
jgi:hypothetical protein